MNNADIQQNLRLQESRLNKANNAMGNQTRIQSLRDDPIAAGHLVRYKSFEVRTEQFEKNASILADRLTVQEGYIHQTVDIMQRVRELAVEGANGIYSKDDMQNMAVEVDQLLQELVQNANAVSADGTPLFAGISTNRTPFEIQMGPVAGADGAMITGVLYNGSIGTNTTEVDENSYMTMNAAGNKVFWAENQQLYGLRDATGFAAAEDAVINIDGKDIAVTSGDNVYAIIAKINNSGASVKASLDPVTNGLNLSTTDAHQLWLQDTHGKVLYDLGLIKDSSQQPPYNLAASTTISGGSLFDTVIALRDSLIRGDTESVGGRVLGGLDAALDNLETRLTENGSLYQRAEANITRAQKNQLDVTAMISREGDLDFTTALTDLKMMEYVQQATLATAGKLYNNTLLNYMR